jgi:hypothetical protein
MKITPRYADAMARIIELDKTFRSLNADMEEHKKLPFLSFDVNAYNRAVVEYAKELRVLHNECLTLLVDVNI